MRPDTRRDSFSTTSSNGFLRAKDHAGESGEHDPECGWYIYPPVSIGLDRAARKNRVVRDGWASAFSILLDLAYLQECHRHQRARLHLRSSQRERGADHHYDPRSITTNQCGVSLRPQLSAQRTLSYQWPQLTEIKINNATIRLYDHNAQASHSGVYSVMVTNALASASAFRQR